jgi:hypothetical protein
VALLSLGDTRIDLTAVSEGPARTGRPARHGSFSGYDLNKDGFLDSREASRMINSPLVAMLRLADRDRDDKLSEKEVHRRRGDAAADDEQHGIDGVRGPRPQPVRFPRRRPGRPARVARLRTAWERLRAWDRNGDGVMVREEVPHQFRMTVSRTRPQVQAQG